MTRQEMETMLIRTARLVADTALAVAPLVGRTQPNPGQFGSEILRPTPLEIESRLTSGAHELLESLLTTQGIADSARPNFQTEDSL